MDQEPDDQAMAQMLGFSSFGAQDPPQKRRRYNPGGGAVASTGSNTTPLGARKPNAEEIDLDDDEEAAPVEQVTSAGVSSEAPQTSALHGLPQRPAPGAGFTDQGRGSQHHHGDQGQPWYEDYYDTLFNRNPWEKLEKAMGLQPRGSWISHDG